MATDAPFPDSPGTTTERDTAAAARAREIQTRIASVLALLESYRDKTSSAGWNARELLKSRDAEIETLRREFEQNQQTARTLQQWGEALASALPFSSRFRKGKRQFHQWLSKEDAAEAHAPLEPNPREEKRPNWSDAIDDLTRIADTVGGFGFPLDDDKAGERDPVVAAVTGETRLALARTILEQFQDRLILLTEQTESLIQSAGSAIARLKHSIPIVQREIWALRDCCEQMAAGLSPTPRFLKVKHEFQRWHNDRSPNTKPASARPFEKLLHEAKHDPKVKRLELLDLHFDLAQLFATMEPAGSHPFSPDCQKSTVDQPLSSIVALASDQIPRTLRCLQSIYTSAGATRFEVIVVEQSAEQVDYRGLVPNPLTRIVRNPSHPGFAERCNAGAAAARGEYLVFLDHNTRAGKGWLDSLLKAFERHADAGLAGSKRVGPDGALWDACGIVWNDGSGESYGRGKNPRSPEYNYFRETDYCFSTGTMIRRDLFAELGGFSLDFANGAHQKMDLAFRIRQRELKVYYQPLSVVTQYGVPENEEPAKAAERARFSERWKTVLAAGHQPSGNRFHARDRSAGKRVMVVTDQRVPAPDQDAGSRSTFHYIELFLKLGFNVKLIASDFIATQPYTRNFEALGIEVLYGNNYKNGITAWFAEHNEFIDYVFSNRLAVTNRFLETFKQLKRAKILFYGHDLASLRRMRQYELSGDPAIRELAEKDAALERKIWAACDVVFYPSFVETKYVKEAMPSVDARTLPLNILKPKGNHYAANLDEKKEILFVGGFLHQPNIDAVQWFVEMCWPTIAQALPEANFRIVGSAMPPEIVRLAGPRIIIDGWLTDAELSRRYGESRVVVIPLRFGAGIKGKVVEAIHQHVPAVITPIAAEGLPGVERLLPVAADAATFSHAVISLYRDPVRLVEIAARSGDYIASHFSEAFARVALGF